MTLSLTKREAFRFLLVHHGLLGKRRFRGKEGVLSFIRQCGCIQFDPLDVCGRNADLTLQSRVDGYRPSMLSDLLYEERKLVDFFDKNLSILPMEDWKLCRDAAGWFLEDGRSREEVEKVRGEVVEAIRSRGPLCSGDLALSEKVPWFWADSPLGRVALESLYYEGTLIVHHKQGTRKFYALTADFIDPENRLYASPFSDDELRSQRLLRRIGAVGLLWNRHSDAFLGIRALKTPDRNRVFSEWLEKRAILPVQVEGLENPLYLRAADEAALSASLKLKAAPPRVEFLAPLDPMMWDRRLIRELTGFDYTWEIYTVGTKRKYGHYVLPMLYGDRFAGRVEFTCDRNLRILHLKNVWFEDGFRPSAAFEKAFAAATDRFRRFNDCLTLQDMRQAKGE